MNDGPLAKNQPEPVTGPWVYTEAVCLLLSSPPFHFHSLSSWRLQFLCNKTFLKLTQLTPINTPVL